MSRLDEFHGKLQRVREFLAERGLDVAVLSTRHNFAWLTAGGCNHVSTSSALGAAALAVLRDRAVCVANTIEAPRLAAEELSGLGIEMLTHPWYESPASVWTDLLGALRVGTDHGGLGVQTVPLGPAFDHLRWALSTWEMDRYRRLGRAAAEALEAACRATRAGHSEAALAARISGPLQAQGIRTPVVLVAADDRVKHFRHPLPTDAVFRGCGMGVVGAERWGLHVSATRLFSFEPLSLELRARHEAVCHVDAELIAATRPGHTLGEVLAVGQAAYAAGGFPDEWQSHHQGGSTGYLGREVKAVPGDPTPVLENQAFAWNPSISGTKSEDTIVVTADGNELISSTGQWPCRTYPAGGRDWPRCDILRMRG